MKNKKRNMSKYDISGSFATAIRLGIWATLSVMTGYVVIVGAALALKSVAMHYGVLDYFLIPGTDLLEGDVFMILFVVVAYCSSKFYKKLMIWCDRHIKFSVKYVK